MRKILNIAVRLIPLLLSMHANAGSCPKLLAYGNPEYPPYLWRSSKDSRLLVGANTDYLALVTKETKIPIDVQYGGTWARVQEEARYGRVDLIAGAFLTSERKTYLHYIEPSLVTTKTVIWVTEKDPVKFLEWSDLKGIQGVTVINNSFGQKFDDYAKTHLKLTYVASLKQAFEMLKNRRVKYLVYEAWPARAFVERYKITGVKAMDPVIAEEPLFLVMTKKSPCATKEIIEKVTTAHQKMMKQNLMPALLKENSGRWDANTF